MSICSHWIKTPIDMSDLDLSGDLLKKHWDQIHVGNHEPFPEDETLRNVWRLYHQGKYAQAVEAGLAAGGAAIVPAAFAGTIYAHYVEPEESKKTEIFREVKSWCEQAEKDGLCSANLHYMHAVVMGRYSQFISMIEALAQGFGGRIKEQMEKCLALDDQHAEGHATLAGWNAEISDQAGALMAKMLYGATRESALEHYAIALELAPDSPIPYIENAAGLDAIYGDSKKNERMALLESAMKKHAVDAMQRLDKQQAMQQLAVLKTC